MNTFLQADIVKTDAPVWSWFFCAIVFESFVIGSGQMVRRRWIHVIGDDRKLIDTAYSFEALVDGISSTVSGVVSAIGGAADSIIKDFAGSTTLGELTSKIDTFAGSVNDSKGLILGLKTDLKNGLLNKIDQVATGAIERNIDFNVDSSITDAINQVKYAGLAALAVS